MPQKNDIEKKLLYDYFYELRITNYELRFPIFNFFNSFNSF